MWKRGIAAALTALVLLGLAPANSGEADGAITPREFCLESYETRLDPEFGEEVTGYWVPMLYDFPDLPEPMVQDLAIQSLEGCVTTVARGIKHLRADGAIPADRLTVPAALSQCMYLEEVFGIEWPYSFYGNPEYTAHNRAQCAHFLLKFHSGQLPPGSPPVD